MNINDFCLWTLWFWWKLNLYVDFFVDWCEALSFRTSNIEARRVKPGGASTIHIFNLLFVFLVIANDIRSSNARLCWALLFKSNMFIVLLLADSFMCAKHCFKCFHLSSVKCLYQKKCDSAVFLLSIHWFQLYYPIMNGYTGDP